MVLQEKTKNILHEYLNNYLWNTKSQCPKDFEDDKELQDLFVETRSLTEKFLVSCDEDDFINAFSNLEKLYALLGTKKASNTIKEEEEVK